MLYSVSETDGDYIQRKVLKHGGDDDRAGPKTRRKTYTFDIALPLELTNSHKNLLHWHVFPYLNAKFVNKYIETLLRSKFSF